MTRRDTDPPEPLERLVARIDATPAGSSDPDTVASGFPSLDRMLGGGLRRQDLVVLATSRIRLRVSGETAGCDHEQRDEDELDDSPHGPSHVPAV